MEVIMGIEVFKDKESIRREEEERAEKEAEEKRAREKELDRNISYLSIATQICVARNSDLTTGAIIEIARSIRSAAEKDLY